MNIAPALHRVLQTGLLLSLASALLLPVPAAAMPAYARLYKQEYGYMPSCNACHSDGGGSALNPFGKAFKQAGKNAGAFATIANLDSDGDGGSNAAEAAGKSNPGSKSSTLAKPGDWLDMASLIPREVKALFPTTRTWLPKDALLTPADINTAKVMGVTLSKADENTIYIPLENLRPIGTALIFPATYQGKVFFLLMSTDRQLKVTNVEVLHADAVPAAKQSGIYSSFKGMTVNQLPSAKGQGLDAAITTAVKQAGALLYIRLKGA